VVTGFVAGTAKGTVTTLGRGGSDYSASIVGAALKADEIWIMTDVDGIMTADPKIEPRAKVIDVISYLEATELAYFGAKVLHPKTIQPAMELDIPVRVRNASKPEKEGTLIVRKSERSVKIVKAITASKNVSLITVGGAGMIGVPGVAAAVFDILGQNGVSVLMISQSSSQANISFAVERKDLDAALNSLRRGFSERHCDWTIEFDRDVSIIATVGAGMKGMPGVAARVFNTIGRNKINILMIAQGSSELNISFATNEHDAVKAVRALHGEFLSGRGR
jgi:aspartate kinase